MYRSLKSFFLQPAVVLSLCHFLVPCYAFFHCANLLGAVFYGLGR
jgi:hypothetical protein